MTADSASWTHINIPEKDQNGHIEQTPNPFLESVVNKETIQNGVKHENGSQAETVGIQVKDSIMISPPPLNTKAGRGRRSMKVSTGVIV